MKIVVVTPDNGEVVFESATDWETQDGRMGDEGNLQISRESKTDDDIEVLAEFARGSWLYVYAVEDPETDKSARARVWDDLVDVPAGVVVRPKDPSTSLIAITGPGRGWYIDEGDPFPNVPGWPLAVSDGRLGPFTEVLP